MRLLLHVLRHDIIRHRRWLLGWAAISALEMLEMVRLGHLLPASPGAARAIALTAFGAAQSSVWVAALTIVASIHADSAVVSTRFWLTRPISRRLLLASKLSLVVLLALGGTAVQVVAAASHGGSLAVLGEIFCFALFVRLFILLVIAALAAITPDAGRFLLALLISVFAIPILARLAGMLIGFRSRPGVTTLDEWMVPMSVAMACSLGVLALQTLKRRHWPSVALCVGGMALTVASGIFWPWHLAFLTHIWPEPAPSSLAGTSLTLDPTRLQVERGRDVSASFLLHGPLRLTGLPEGESAVVDPIRTSVSWQSGPDAVLEGSAEAGRPRTEPSLDREFDAAADAIRGTRLNPWIGETSPTALAVVVPRDTAQRALVDSSLAGPGTLTLTADMAVTPVKLVGRLPATHGASTSVGTTRVTILAVESMSDQVRVALGLQELQRPFGKNRPLFVALVNRHTRGMLVDLGARPSGPFSPLTAIQTQEMHCVWSARESSSALAQVDSSWLANADVYLFEVGTTQDVRRTLTLTTVTVPQSPAGAERPAAR